MAGQFHHHRAAMAPDRPSSTPPGARDLYRRYFDTVIVGEDDRTLREEVFRLRYQVYCVENPFEDPADNPDGLERDSYDERAVHCLLRHKPSGNWAGTARLILPDAAAPEASFVLQQVCDHPMIADAEQFPILRMAEISRFCVSKDFRKRQGDALFPASNEPTDRRDERRVIPNMTLGIIEGLIELSLARQIHKLFAMMEPALLRLLTRLGIHFQHIGSLVDYHGRRQPCFIELSTMLTQVHDERPDVWDILTDSGRHWDLLQHQRMS